MNYISRLDHQLVRSELLGLKWAAVNLDCAVKHVQLQAARSNRETKEVQLKTKKSYWNISISKMQC